MTDFHQARVVPSVRAIAPLPLLAVALALGIAIAYWIASNAPDFKNLALGEQTAPVYGSLDGAKIFCGTLDEARECLSSARTSPLAKRVLWLGNSQLYAINQFGPGDETAPIVLARLLKPQRVQVTAFAYPSASLSELLLLYKWLARDLRPDVLIVPAFLDDTREQTIRSELAPAFDRGDIAAMLNRDPIGAEMRSRLIKPQSLGGAEKQDTSMQARSENWITGRLEACCAMQRARSDARGTIELQAFFFRNWLFNVTAQSVRPIIPQPYRINLGALRLMLADARKAGTKVIVYIPPLRNDVKPPYDPNEYVSFKRDVQRLTATFGATFVDEDKLVPGQYWGTKAATRTGGAPEYDFMHYQGSGHRLLAKAMLVPVQGALQ